MIRSFGQDQNLPLKDRKTSLDNKKANSLAFKGGWPGSAASSFFSMIQTNEIAGPTVVNISSMVIPRTAVDYTRNEEAGIETARREVTSLVSSSLLPGFYAIAAGWLIGLLNNPMKVRSTLMTNNDMVDVLKNNWDKAENYTCDREKVLENTIKQTLKETKALVGDTEKGLSRKTADEFAIRLKKLILNKDKLPIKKLKEGLKDLKTWAVEQVGAEQQLKVSSGGKVVETSMKNLIGDMYNIPNELLLKYGCRQDVSSAVEKFKSLSNNKGVIGFSLAASIAISTQFINRYITQQKTGTSAFVGLPEYEKIAGHKIEEKKEPSKFRLNAEKVASVGIMAYMLGATYASSLDPRKIVEFASKRTNLLEKLRFKGKFPTLNQLRALSAITISGRILASADVNELRETNTRDFLGFLNWLVFGGFVTKLTGDALEGNKVLNQKSGFKGGSWLQKKVHIIKNTFLKTDDEINAIKNISQITKKRLIRNKNIAIAAGLVYSTLTLGIGVPLFNKYLTNKVADKKDPEQKPVPEKTNKKEKFYKDLVLVEETLGSIKNTQGVIKTSSSAFFNIPQEDPLFNKFLVHHKELNR